MRPYRTKGSRPKSAGSMCLTGRIICYRVSRKMCGRFCAVENIGLFWPINGLPTAENAWPLLEVSPRNLQRLFGNVAKDFKG